MTSINHNLFQTFSTQFEAQANKILLITDHNKPFTYAEINQESAKLANSLTQLGVSAGDRVSVQVKKSPQALCLYLACLRAGFVFHPLNPAYKPQELDYFLRNAEPTAFICDTHALSLLSPIANAANIKHQLTLNADGAGSLTELSRNCQPTFECVHRVGNDTAALLYSSGTTGVPKGIMLTHKNLSSNANTLVDTWGFRHEDRLLHALPIFHVHGLFVALNCVLGSGASMRWLPAFHADSAIKYLPESTVFMGVPTYYTRLLDKPNFDHKITRNVRLFISGSAPLLNETFTRFEQRTGQRILERYGMTETNMNSSNPLNGERRAGTVGPPLPDIEIRIADEKNTAKANNEIGNVQVRGPNVFKGYWKLPEKTAEDFTQDGFFNTGDKGKIDDSGYLSIVGRTKDVIITGGLNVYPKEVELIIDDIAGVKESAVIGLPHADFGEAVVAVVTLDGSKTLNAQQLINLASSKLANYKTPKRVIFKQALPRNAMGKVQKKVLRADYSNIDKK